MPLCRRLARVSLSTKSGKIFTGTVTQPEGGGGTSEIFDWSTAVWWSLATLAELRTVLMLKWGPYRRRHGHSLEDEKTGVS